MRVELIEILVLLGPVVGIAALAWRGRGRWGGEKRGPRGSDWKRVVKEAGVSDLLADPDGSFGGTDGPLWIRVRTVEEKDVVAAHVAISGLAPEIGLERGGLGSRLREAMGVGDLEVGDPAFDAEIAVASSEPLVARALLDANTRARVRGLFGAGFPVRVGGGTLEATLRREVGAPFRPDMETLRALLELAHRLEPFTRPEKPLVRIVRADPLASVRAAALRALLESAPEHPKTREALRAAVRDKDPSIRLRAALAHGDEGLPALTALAVDAEIDDAISAEAVAALGTRFPLEAAVMAVRRAARGERVRTGEAAVAVLAEGGDPSAEPALVAALAVAEPSLAAAAAKALGRCGGVGAIPDLARAEEASGPVRRAAREAIALIQSRLTGATPGQVSLIGGDAGQVSLAPTADGRLSLPPKD